ncbi:UDP-glucuronosyl/UDP-glucosyltransferase [Parasponia andersonii]|uniref:Glycosyltransferase n=1 Tax=Parasponia andersonii TaxID=3476 RepID=A0A2P5E287_PARAD|nr:UDP-glucuronosyl/UDP-glucosyltransferase [Parasponia andersonii]
MSSSGDLISPQTTHVALFPSAGMGHLIPFLRFGALLLRRGNCRVTLITINPTVSLAESQHTSQFLSAYPQVTHLQLNLIHVDPATVNSDDPFWLRFEAVRRSAHLLRPLLSSASPPLSALVHDVSLISPVIPIAESLSLPSYVLFPASARMLSFVSYFPTFAGAGFGSANSDPFLRIPGILPIPRSSVPPPLLDSNSLFSKILVEDSPNLSRLNGIFINSYDGMDTESVEALNGGKVSKGSPPLSLVGPFPPFEFEKTEWSTPSEWLDEQAEGSVVFVSFGSRTALSRVQITEVGEGLLKSGCRFFWVVKDKKVDKEDDESLNDVVGGELLERMKGQGLVVKQWVDQGEILGHRAVGGFLSHCGWNSVMEAAQNGVRVLGWPQHGDQKINAEVVRASGLGIWVESWGWSNESVVKRDEIAERVRELMGSESLKLQAAKIGDVARKASEVGGTRDSTLERLIGEWEEEKKKNNHTRTTTLL